MRSLFKFARATLSIDAADARCGRRGFRWGVLGGLTIASSCAVLCMFVVGVGSAGAATQFGSFGTEAGQLYLPLGVAVDQSTGDVYVGDENNNRVDKFDGPGQFLLAWGFNVNGTPGLQTCTTSSLCEAGTGGAGSGEFSEFSGSAGVAVDQATHDVYVADFGNHRVQKFNSSGEFILMFGGEVNEAKDNTPAATDAEKDVCVAGEACKEGTPGTGEAQFEWAYRHSYIAVGPGGRVYVGDKARVQVFEASGAWRESISLLGLSATGQVTALAVDSGGNVYVADSEAAGVHVFEPGGLEKLVQLDATSTQIESIALDGAGDLFVGDATKGFHVLEFGPTGEELASFAEKTAAQSEGMAFDDSLGELYASDGIGAIWVLAPPPPGPLVESGSETATPEHWTAGEHANATVAAQIDPEGRETTYRFEYVDETHFQENGYASAPDTPGVLVGSGCPSAGASCFEDQFASAHLSGLVPGTKYHYRVVASNSNGTAVGSDQTFTAIPPALVEGPWVTDVAATSATFAGRIDPLGVSTEYRLEYGTSTSYGHTLSASVGAGESNVTISYHSDGLEAGTTYHYRLVTTGEAGTAEGADHTFTTQLAGGLLLLPDGRTWELVSPANKKGALIEPSSTAFLSTQAIQAASDGSGIAYISVGAHVGEAPAGKTFTSHDLAERGPGGWSTEDITLPKSPYQEGSVEGVPQEYDLFSPDLSAALVSPRVGTTPLLSPEATESTPYLRNDSTRTFAPLVTAGNVPPGTRFGGETTPEGSILPSTDKLYITVLAATPDLDHIVIGSPLALTRNAISVLSPAVGFNGCGTNEAGGCGLKNIYEWNGGNLRLVNILPDGEATHGQHLSSEDPPLNVHIVGQDDLQRGSAARSVSADGRWIAWTLGQPYSTSEGTRSTLYVRDMVAEKTVQIGGVHARYQTMSSDGSRIFFLENGDLYEFDTSSDTTTDLTSSHGAGESGAGVKEVVVGISEDGSRVYFVATAVLAPGAVSGEDNLYSAHDDGGTWSMTHVATLSSEDGKSWYAQAVGGNVNLSKVTSRVSPDGRYLAFMSSRSLTDYDNIDAVSGLPDEEVYLYDAVADRLICASCDPTGARPVGVLDHGNQLLVDRDGIWSAGSEGESDHWLAGNIPGWDSLQSGGYQPVFYQPRYLSASGRLFFNSPDALVPQDTNGLEDVYEFEPTGIGGCTAATATYSERLGGCVSLVSSGTSSSESVFYDASENGDDVFFSTASRLTAADYDTGYDLYDAHVCSVSVPCASTPVSPPPCTSGDSCKAAPSPQPEIFGAAPSATFSGTGNVTVSASTPPVKQKTLTRAQKLARALTICHKKKNKRKRLVCERHARKRYARPSRTTKATKRGHK